MLKLLLLTISTATIVGYGSCAVLLPNIDICDFPCTLQSTDLICTVENGTYKFFESECMLKKYSCINGQPKLIRAPVSECLMRSESHSEICEFMCPEMYTPVCGQNGKALKIFRNSCLMGKQSCTDKTLWEFTAMAKCLQRTPAAKCPVMACPMNYDPICGQNDEDFTIFANQCEMDTANCRSDKRWKKAHMLSCDVNLNSRPELLPALAPEPENFESCPRACTKIFWPVCGSDGVNLKIFSNNCVMKQFSCERNELWKELTFAECLFKV